MTIPANHRKPPLKLNGEDGLIKVRRSELSSSFPNEGLAEEAIFERYDAPLRLQIGRPNHSQEISPNEADTTCFRDTFMWARTGGTDYIGDGKPGVWVLDFMLIERGSFDDILQETIENGKTFTAIAASHMDIIAVLAGEERSSILTMARWASVGRFLETVHTLAKEKIPPTKLLKKLSLPRFNKFLEIAGHLSGRREAYHPYKLIKQTTSNNKETS